MYAAASAVSLLNRLKSGCGNYAASTFTQQYGARADKKLQHSSQVSWTTDPFSSCCRYLQQDILSSYNTSKIVCRTWCCTSHPDHSKSSALLMSNCCYVVRPDKYGNVGDQACTKHLNALNHGWYCGRNKIQPIDPQAISFKVLDTVPASSEKGVRANFKSDHTQKKASYKQRER